MRTHATDLTEAQWALVHSIIPEGKPGGRPRSIDVRAVVNAIFYSRTAVLAYPRDNADDIRMLFHFGGRSRRQSFARSPVPPPDGWATLRALPCRPQAEQAVFIHVLRLHPHAAEGAAATSDNKSSIT